MVKTGLHAWMTFPPVPKPGCVKIKGCKLKQWMTYIADVDPYSMGIL